jgi:hypothetical protein
VVLDCTSRTSAIAELAQPILGMKKGRVSFSRTLPVLHRPKDGAAVGWGATAGGASPSAKPG